MNPTASPETIAGDQTSPVPNAVQGASAGLEMVLLSLRPHMAELDRFLRGQISAFEPEIREMADYCIDTGGKRIRPALVFLSGGRVPGPIQPDLVRVAAVVELVHLATLVHDDIMDEAEVRRGRRTAARSYGPVAAVLLGDALFAHALHLAAQFPTTEVCLAVSASTRRVCAGEVVQTLRRGSTDFSATDYQRVIELKTAELFRVSCRLGAALAGQPPAYVEAAGRFGRHLGVAYQIYDDLADFFGEEKRIGKTLGTDLASGKLTLPLLLLLDKLAPQERAELLQEIEGNRPPQLALHLRQMREHGVFAAVAESIQSEIDAARDALAPWSHAVPAPGLLALCDAIVDQVDAIRPA
jgi:octaprenyl-diphosphate synthase